MVNLEISEEHAMLMFNIINILSKRGVFLPEEYKIVGELFEFLKNKLNIYERIKSQQKVESENLENLEKLD